MRKLTINRIWSIIACAGRIFVYIETNDLTGNDNTISINQKCFKRIGTISNGKTLNVDISYETVEVMIAFSAMYPSHYNVRYSIQPGSEDVVLYTKPIYSPFRGNPFTIEQTKA